MDGINQINGAQGVQSPINSNQIRNQEVPDKQPPPPPFNVEISQLGQLFSAVEELGKSAKNKLKQFHESLFEALQSGNFDAESFVENVSDEIKAIAYQAGIDLQMAITEFSEQAQYMNSQFYQELPQEGRPHHGPPPPPPDELVSSLNGTDEEDYSEIETNNIYHISPDQVK